MKIQPPAALICLTAAESTTRNGQDENAGILSAGCKPECSEVLYLCWQYQLHASIKIIKKKKFLPDVRSSQLHQKRFSHIADW